MASITIRNLPDDLVERIKERAACHQRSMEQEVRRMLQEHYPTREAWMGGVEASHRMQRRPITAEEVDAGKRNGRP